METRIKVAKNAQLDRIGQKIVTNIIIGDYSRVNPSSGKNLFCEHSLKPASSPLQFFQLWCIIGIGQYIAHRAENVPL
jgi:hypothetical protein